MTNKKNKERHVETLFVRSERQIDLKMIVAVLAQKYLEEREGEQNDKSKIR